MMVLALVLRKFSTTSASDFGSRSRLSLTKVLKIERGTILGPSEALSTLVAGLGTVEERTQSFVLLKLSMGAGDAGTTGTRDVAGGAAWIGIWRSGAYRAKTSSINFSFSKMMAALSLTS